MSRQAGGRAGSNGGVGLRGPGETKIETDRRRIRERMAKLRREIKGMKAARDTKRTRRLRSETPSIAIVGYTNAGKSSLLNALTGSGVLVQNALFATLDPTTRRAALDDGREYVLTDTVGFVRHLPTQLIEAFRSTLEEVTDADLLLHVVDGSDPLPTDQIRAVHEVITEVIRENDAAAPPELIVVNKIDAADPVTLTQLRGLLPGAAFVSARTGEGIAELRAHLSDVLVRPEIEVSVLLPYNRRSDGPDPLGRSDPRLVPRRGRHARPCAGARSAGVGTGSVQRQCLTAHGGRPVSRSQFSLRAHRSRRRAPGPQSRSSAIRPPSTRRNSVRSALPTIRGSAPPGRGLAGRAVGARVGGETALRGR